MVQNPFGMVYLHLVFGPTFFVETKKSLTQNVVFCRKKGRRPPTKRDIAAMAGGDPRPTREAAQLCVDPTICLGVLLEVSN